MNQVKFLKMELIYKSKSLSKCHFISHFQYCEISIRSLYSHFYSDCVVNIFNSVDDFNSKNKSLVKEERKQFTLFVFTLISSECVYKLFLRR